MCTQRVRGYLECFLGRVKVDLDVEVLHETDDLLQVETTVSVLVGRLKQLHNPPATSHACTSLIASSASIDLSLSYHNIFSLMSQYARIDGKTSPTVVVVAGGWLRCFS